jgi:hypothetical protein
VATITWQTKWRNIFTQENLIKMNIFCKRSQHLNKPPKQEDPDPCFPLWFSISVLHEGETLKQVEHPSYHQQDLLERWNG